VHHALLVQTTAEQQSLYTFLCFTPESAPKFLAGLQLFDVSCLATTRSFTHMYHESSAELNSKSGSTRSAQVEIKSCQHSMM